MRRALILFLLLTMCQTSVWAMHPTLAGLKEQEQLWRLAKHREYKTMPDIHEQKTSSGCEEFLSESFKGNNCYMMVGRERIIHKLGLIGKVSFTIEAHHPYTGLLKSGALGLLRLSLAEPPKAGLHKPGLALMLFVHDKFPENILAMPSIDGQAESNIFIHEYSTALPPPKSSVKNYFLERKCTRALALAGFPAHDPWALSCEHLAKITVKGKELESFRAPFELVFVPTEEARGLLTSMDPQDDFRVYLRGKAQGIVLFKVFARKTRDSTLEPIGRIEATSELISSAFGDEDLRIRHPNPMVKAIKH